VKDLDVAGCSTLETRSVYADLLSQAVTGELVGMLNFAALVDLAASLGEKEEAIEHACSERRHAEAFRERARELGVELVERVDAPYWKGVRSAFLFWAARRDRTACMFLQELILESFAVVLYGAVGEKADGRVGQTFHRIAREEEEHLVHAVEHLREEYRRDPDDFQAKARAVHESVMPTLAQMVARTDSGVHCGLCRLECVKKSLPLVRLDIGDLRGKALRKYLEMLDAIGLPGEVTLGWVARLEV
jgi:hypothetical protein